jgi:ABC-type dipeptide/oligopeptide/nickel transport system permease component
MFRHLIRRFAGMIITLAVVAIITFIALDATPGDAASALVGDNASQSQVQTLRVQLGLDQPIIARVSAFALNALTRGDLGKSFVSHRAVGELVLERLPFTLTLAFGAIALALIIGLGIGVGSAMRAGSWLDTFLMSGAAISLAVPTFWSSLLFVMVFALALRWLPVVGADTPAHFILPTITLALPTAAIIARLVRASLLDVLGADYIRTAQAKGLASRDVLSRHMFRNSALPVINVLGLHLGHLLGGAFVVETIFGVPGLGRLIVQAIFDRDVPVVLGATLTIATMFLVVNFSVDMAHGWLDPQTAHDAI